MLRVNADHYVQAGKLFQRAEKLFDGGLLANHMDISAGHAQILAA
jgi:hypothetical protein